MNKKIKVLIILSVVALLLVSLFAGVVFAQDNVGTSTNTCQGVCNGTCDGQCQGQCGTANYSGSCCSGQTSSASCCGQNFSNACCSGQGAVNTVAPKAGCCGR